MYRLALLLFNDLDVKCCVEAVNEQFISYQYMIVSEEVGVIDIYDIWKRMQFAILLPILYTL